MGFPTVITMTDFVYSGSIIKARLLLKNPDVAAKWFSVRVKAFAGTHDSSTTFGNQYVGYWNFFNIFRTEAGTYYYDGYAPNTGRFYPNKGVWREQTSWSLIATSQYSLTMTNLPAGQGGYAIVEVIIHANTPLETNTETEYCEADFAIGDSSSDDMLTLKSKETNTEKVYFIKKWTTGASPWVINYFKCKYNYRPTTLHYYPTQAIMETDIHYISSVYYPATDTVTLLAYENIGSRFFLELNYDTVMNTIISQGFIWDD